MRTTPIQGLKTYQGYPYTGLQEISAVSTYRATRDMKTTPIQASRDIKTTPIHGFRRY